MNSQQAVARAAPRPGVAAVELRGVRMRYPDGTQALLPVDLQVAQGEFVTLLGPSGCGKTTLLKIIAGLLVPSAGQLRLWPQAGGERDAGAATLGFVFQAPTLMPWASVQANVRLPLDLARVARAQAQARVSDALALVGLEGFAHSLPHTLSGGMQMRASIARALVTRPELLLMDEPFAALDEITRRKFDAELLLLWQRIGLTVVFVTHSIHEAVFLSQRVVMMAARPGRVVEEICIDEPYPRLPQFAVSARFAQFAERLQQSLSQASGAQADKSLPAPPGADG